MSDTTTPVEVDTPAQAVTAFDDLARLCRELAEQAEAADTLGVVSESTTPEAAAVALREAHKRIDQLVQSVQQSAAACRRSSYEALRERGLRNKQIAEAFQCSMPAVGYVLNPEKRAK